MKRHSIETATVSSGSLKRKSNDGRSDLHIAVEAAVCDVVRELLKESTDLNKEDANGWTPLHSACAGGNLDVIELLLQQEKCSGGLKSKKDGSTPLHYLVRHFPSDPSLIRTHEPGGSEKEQKEREREKEKEKEREKEKASNKKGSKRGTNGTNSSRESVADDSVTYHRICRLTKRLVKKGCDPGAANIHGETALHHAAVRGKTPAVEFLLRKKKWNVDINLRTEKYGETCLHFAVRSQSPDTVDVILSHGVDTSIKGSNGTALDVVHATKKNEKMLEILHRHGITSNDISHSNRYQQHAQQQHTQQRQNGIFVFKTEEEMLKEHQEKVAEIKEWMQQLHLPEEYVELLVGDGFDDLNTIKLISEGDLQEVGITKTGHRKKILHWASLHPYVSINFNYHE